MKTVFVMESSNTIDQGFTVCNVSCGNGKLGLYCDNAFLTFIIIHVD